MGKSSDVSAVDFREFNNKYVTFRNSLINLFRLFSLIAYVHVIYFCCEDHFYFIALIPTLSVTILMVLDWLILNGKSLSQLFTTLSFYLAIVNLMSIVCYLFFVDPSVSVLIFLQTLYKFWLPMMLLVAFTSKLRHVLIVGFIAVCWMLFFTFFSNHQIHYTWVLFDCLVFVLITAVFGGFNVLCDQLNEFLKTKDNSQVVCPQKLEKFKENVFNMTIHDLKIPINRVLNASKLEVIPHKEIIDSSKLILLTLQNILDVSKAEESKLVLKLSNLMIGELIENAKEHVDYLLSEKKVSLIINNGCKDVVMLDENLIERILVNLLSNAIRYSKMNSTIEIRITSQYDFVRTEVIDTGEGISSEKIDYVFEKYYHGHTPNSRMNHSTGLGLTFCKMVVEAHGGTIGAKSELNQGFTVWFELPVAVENEMICETVVQYSPPRYFSNDNEDELILQCKKEIADLSIYQTGEILSIFNSQLDNSPDFAYWKDEVVHSSVSGNVDYFNQLKGLCC